jgi:hypothetical protein
LAVFAAALELLQEPKFPRVEAVIAIGVGEPVQAVARRSFGVGIETAVGVEETHCESQRGGHGFDARHLAGGIQGETEERLRVTLGRDVETAAVIECQAHRTLVPTRRTQQFAAAQQQLQRGRRSPTPGTPALAPSHGSRG